MTVTVKGFQGTVSDADMATQFPHLPSVAFTTTDVAVTAGTGRQVSVAAGSGVAHFVKYTSDAAQTLALAPPSSGGKWYLIAINRQWSPTNSAVLEAVDVSIATDGTVPTAGPTPASLTAAGIRNNPGTAGSSAAYGHHQPLAWVHVRAADTTLTIFDLRIVVTTAGQVQARHLSGIVLAGLFRTPLVGAEVACADGVTYQYDGTGWGAESGGWAPGFGGDSGATTGNNGGSDGYFARVGKHITYHGRIVFGSSGVFGGGVIVGANVGGNLEARWTVGDGWYLSASGGTSTRILLVMGVNGSDLRVLIQGSPGLLPLNSLGSPGQSDEMRFVIHGVIIT